MKNKAIQITRRIRFLFLLITLVLNYFQCASGTEVTITGKIYFEASLMEAHAWNSDEWYDYTDALGSARVNNVTISSGSVTTRPNASGEFTITGGTTNGDVLIEAEAEGYQTAYMFVTYEDVLEGVYSQKITPQNMLRREDGGGSISFYNTSSSSCQVYDACQDGGVTSKTDQLGADSRVATILLLKEPNDVDDDGIDDDFIRFEYAPVE